MPTVTDLLESFPLTYLLDQNEILCTVSVVYVRFMVFIPTIFQSPFVEARLFVLQ